MSRLKEALEAGKFVMTAEIGPPKGTNIDKMLEHIDELKDKVDGLNVTDNQSSVMRISSLAVCHLIVERGGEPILQMTCRDRNRLALQSELLSGWVLGARNVLCLTGDFITIGDHPEAKPVFDLDSVQLIQTVKSLNEGKDLAGNELAGSTGYFIGATVTPEADPIEPQMLKFAKKLIAGAQYFQTQAIYDLDNFKRFMEKARKMVEQYSDYPVKFLAGLVPLFSSRMGKYMNENVPGIFVPESILKEMEEAESKATDKKERRKLATQKGVEIAGRMIRELREQGVCEGVHIMAIGREDLVPKIIEASQ